MSSVPSTLGTTDHRCVNCTTLVIGTDAAAEAGTQQADLARTARLSQVGDCDADVIENHRQREFFLPSFAFAVTA